MADYYYHLGMAYVDADEYGKAQPLLDKYLELYRQSPIFRYDEKSGCVALTKLLYEKGMTRAEKETLIREALENLPNNGAAVMQCAMVYLAELNARIKSVIRRNNHGGESRIELGNVCICPSTYEVQIGGKPVEMSRKEYDILLYFVTGRTGSSTSRRWRRASGATTSTKWTISISSTRRLKTSARN